MASSHRAGAALRGQRAGNGGEGDATAGVGAAGLGAAGGDPGEGQRLCHLLGTSGGTGGWNPVLPRSPPRFPQPGGAIPSAGSCSTAALANKALNSGCPCPVPARVPPASCPPAAGFPRSGRDPPRAFRAAPSAAPAAQLGGGSGRERDGNGNRRDGTAPAERPLFAPPFARLLRPGCAPAMRSPGALLLLPLLAGESAPPPGNSGARGGRGSARRPVSGRPRKGPLAVAGGAPSGTPHRQRPQRFSAPQGWGGPRPPTFPRSAPAAAATRLPGTCWWDEPPA